MKPKNLIIPLCALSLCACERLSITSTITQGNVRISIVQIDQQPITRAAVQDYASMLSFCIYDKTNNRLKQINQTKSQSDFGTITLNLDDGSYKLVIIAHNGTTAPTMTDVSKITFKDNKLTDTFLATDDFYVEDDTEICIQLERCVSMIRLKTTAAATADAKQMKIYYTGGSSTLSGLTGYGSVNSRQTEYRDIPQGTNATYDVYTFPHALTDTIKYTATALDANDNILKEMTVAEVPVKKNYITTLTGSFWNIDDNKVTISIDDSSIQWGNININY